MIDDTDDELTDDDIAELSDDDIIEVTTGGIAAEEVEFCDEV